MNNAADCWGGKKIEGVKKTADALGGLNKHPAFTKPNTSTRSYTAEQQPWLKLDTCVLITISLWVRIKWKPTTSKDEIGSPSVRAIRKISKAINMFPIKDV